jgi:hypothetical protein
VERFVMLRNALNLLSAVWNAAQHGLACRTEPQRSEVIDLEAESLAIPAGLEPATRGVEIRYSIQLSYGTVGANRS